ncbi:Reverse transcriptase-RNase H-integrase [Mycena chlorophos]|uniref:Reverse transcriptase-RNase H-integrase n=1 Tax=Mycena chlorophos TaxID=658473 RepID=A0A8H6W4A6_MYCCL|nr:Reverse transcriptase-RNase H-integrase [Mycena chlorophos]
MRDELETAYIPACPDCQRNKSSTKRKAGPLHPLPVPDGRCDSVAIDFIGPLPEDSGFNCCATLTDRLGSEFRFVPTRTNVTAEDFALQFFENWYCENGLPQEIVSDRDKIFVSKFWRALHKLTGVKLKMSTAYHPETDGSSERTNKTLIQCLRYHVSAAQNNWVRALPRVRFNMMSTVNASTGFAPFQLRFGQMPRVIPALGTIKPLDRTRDAKAAEKLLALLHDDIAEARDNLLLAKASQAHQANKTRLPTPNYKVGDRVSLATRKRRKHFLASGKKRVAKFMVRNEGPYKITAVHNECSTVTLDLGPNSKMYPVFHTAEVTPWNENDNALFPGRELTHPGPVVTLDGQEEFYVDEIIDKRERYGNTEYRVRWRGYGRESDDWLDESELVDSAHLEAFQNGLSQSGISDLPDPNIADTFSDPPADSPALQDSTVPDRPNGVCDDAPTHSAAYPAGPASPPPRYGLRKRVGGKVPSRVRGSTTSAA